MARLCSHCWELGIPECFDGDTSRRCKCHCRLTTVPVYACRRQNPVYKQESKTNTHTTIIAGTAASSQLVLLMQPGGSLFSGGFACSEDKRESVTHHCTDCAKDGTHVKGYETTSDDKLVWITLTTHTEYKQECPSTTGTHDLTVTVHS